MDRQTPPALDLGAYPAPESPPRALATYKLFSAARRANADGIREALSQGGNPRARDKAGSTPLMTVFDAWALVNPPDWPQRIAGCAEILIPLSELSGPLSTHPSGRTLLAQASGARHGAEGLLKALLGAGCSDLDAPAGSFTALMDAASTDDARRLRQLLLFSLIDAQDARGWTALMVACSGGSERCFEVLLPLSNLDPRDIAGRDALDLCRAANRSAHARMEPILDTEMESRALARAVPPASSRPDAPRL